MNRSKCVAIWIGMLSLGFVLATYGQNEIAGETALSYGGPPNPEEMALSGGELSGTWVHFHQW